MIVKINVNTSTQKFIYTGNLNVTDRHVFFYKDRYGNCKQITMSINLKGNHDNEQKEQKVL